MSHKHLFLAIALVALLGVFNAAYLSWTALMGEAPTCLLDSGCDIVAASPYSNILGIPLALLGVFFYSMIVGFSLWRFVTPGVVVLPYLLPLATIGFALSFYFLYLQAFVISAYCEYCLFSLFDATVIFVLSLYLWLREKKHGTLEGNKEYGSV